MTANATVFSAEVEPLYPPAVVPSVAAGVYANTVRFIRNPISALPQSVYETRLVRDKWRPDKYIWTADPDNIARVLLHDAARFAKTGVDIRIFEPATGRGILTSEGETWRWHRKAAAPMFRHADLLQYVPAMTAAARRQLDQWRNQTTQGRCLLAIDDAMASCTFEVITNTIFAGCDAKTSASIRASGEQFLEPISWEILFAILKVPRWVPFPGKRRMLSAAASLRDAVGRVVSERRIASKPSDDILGRLIATRHPETSEAMSDQEIIDDLATFLLAGHETTARALTWSLYLLARSPSWQRRVRDEVNSVAGDKPLDASHLDQLTLTTQVLKEAMRLYPPIPVISRRAVETTDLGGEAIAKDAILILPIYALHRHRSHWDDPDRFDPDRFTPEREALMHRAQYVPFGFGPRVCIGAAFAMLEAKLLLAEFIRSATFEWDGQHLPEPIARVSLRPQGGMPLYVTVA